MTISRLCGCSFVRPGLSLTQGLDWVRRQGFHHVDIGFGGANGHVPAVDVSQNPRSFARQVAEETQRRQLQPNECFVLNFGWPINSRDPAEQKRTVDLFPGLCRFAATAGFSSILLIPGPIHARLGREKSLDLSVSALSGLAKVANDHGVRLHVEADAESCANTPETAEELCGRVEYLYLTLDYSHFICQGIEHDRIERLHRYTRHLHIRQAAPGRLVAPVEEGTIDFSRVLGQLESGGYRGLYCIEYLSDEAERRTVGMMEQLNAMRVESAIPHGSRQYVG